MRERFKPGTLVEHFRRNLDPDMWCPDLINSYRYEIVEYAKSFNGDEEYIILRPLHKKDWEDHGSRLVTMKVDDFYAEVDCKTYPNVKKKYCFEEVKLEPSEEESRILREMDENRFSSVSCFEKDNMKNLFREIYYDGVKEGLDIAVFRLQLLHGIPAQCGDEYLDKNMPAIKRTIELCERLELSKR
ncbi:hypothetical protein SAMN05421493_11829 [Pseudobutyrivibrio sp. 49]|uniref:hypothetical protein n=1 Tax=Pseudobutyrivibrio sp. 49 TaxID=1855344 RepID=UPI0008890544|nr:hypothetical protein [Pseudobutyrivibrio sp. 49]SDI56575.1 hypothetical protein SAMN05421493_11829 [Pseudobutyrivibrio sp. 49]